MVAGLARGLNHEDAARFSFRLATPIILAESPPFWTGIPTELRPL